ncbi:anti-sigma factor [Roseivirga echinicomitans]
MDIQAYIASGVLEAYWAGELSDEEMQEVDALSVRYPEIAKELSEIRELLMKMSNNQSVTDDDVMIDLVIRTIGDEEKDAFLEAIEDPEERVKKIRVVPWWSAAAAVLLFLSIAFNVYFFLRMRTAKDDVRKIAAENSKMAYEIEATEQELGYAELRVAHFLNEDNIHVRLGGSELSPQSFANVFWDKNTNAVFISVDNLPEPPKGHQYQLWAIKAGQAPIDAGIFDHNQLVQELKVIKGDVQAFAITLEEEGGTPIATVEKTYARGFLKKS